MKELLGKRKSILKKGLKIDNCDHEEEFYCYADIDEMKRYRAMCFWVKCKLCGNYGISVDDTGTFWNQEDFRRKI